MRNRFFDYGPCRLNVHFVQAGYGDMCMHLRLRTGVDSPTGVDGSFAPNRSSSGGGALVRRRLGISSAFCPFPQMIAWLEAISLGLDHCDWRWDGEGPLYGLRWNGIQLAIEDPSNDRPEELRLTLDRRELVAAFYRPFRRFAGSRRYRPDDYERRRFGEIMVEAEGHGLTEEELRGRLLTLGAAELEPVLQALHQDGILATDDVTDHFPNVYRDPKARPGGAAVWLFPYVTGEWDGWDTRRRRAHLCKIFDAECNTNFGTPLRGLRSEIVERFLDTGRAKAR